MAKRKQKYVVVRPLRMYDRDFSTGEEISEGDVPDGYIESALRVGHLITKDDHRRQQEERRRRQQEARRQDDGSSGEQTRQQAEETPAAAE